MSNAKLILKIYNFLEGQNWSLEIYRQIWYQHWSKENPTMRKSCFSQHQNFIWMVFSWIKYKNTGWSSFDTLQVHYVFTNASNFFSESTMFADNFFEAVIIEIIFKIHRGNYSSYHLALEYGNSGYGSLWLHTQN